MNLFITGTDTNVGKTYAAALLIKALRAQGIDCVGMKPICCGDRKDAEILWEAGDRCLALDEVNPVWLQTPAAPYVAALLEDRQIDPSVITQTFHRIKERHTAIIVEGVGGWRVPITSTYSVNDMALEFGIPVAVVVENKLGALNHALLTVEAVQRQGLTCAGLILNQAPVALRELSPHATATNRNTLESLLNLPILFEIARGQTDLSETALRVIAEAFPFPRPCQDPDMFV